jgi:hypothetical protein
VTTSALTAPLSPAAYATERTPLGDEAWLRVTLDRIFADLRDTWEPAAICGTCEAAGDEPCRTRSGRVAKAWHAGRRSA